MLPAALACAWTPVYNNYFVPPNYDSMIGKIIPTAIPASRPWPACARLLETVVEGIKTNIPLHQDLMVDSKFMEGGTNIHYLEEWLTHRTPNKR
jgi:acetyl-CoA carboxylase biotin carboxylase subunit